MLVGVLMAGPAAASAAEPVQEVAPISQEIVPISDEGAFEPISDVVEGLTRPLGLSIFLGSALTLGAGGIAIARVAAQRKQAAAVKSES